MSCTIASKKRRRVLTTENDMKITDLPDWAIKEVITYIPKTSRALLALALTTDSASWREIHWDKSAPKSILSWFNNTTITKMMRPSAITKAILSPRNEEENDMWEEINFEDNDINLCWKLNDDDIAGILACTNSVKHLKRLFLPDCMEITGRALEPLRGSSILEQLDVSLLRNHWNAGICRDGWRRETKPGEFDTNLLQTEVIPILNSIIGRENNSLRHLHFPQSWRQRADNGYFMRFWEEYNQSEQQRNIQCFACNAICRESLSLFREDETSSFSNKYAGKYSGIQHFTCYDCLSYYCYNCKDDDGHFLLSFCVVCEKWRCRECMDMKPCNSCRGDAFVQSLQPGYAERNNMSYICTDCEENVCKGDGSSSGMEYRRKCEQCNNVYCCNCQPEMEYCKICNRFGCESCMHVLECEHNDCQEKTCETCRNIIYAGSLRASVDAASLRAVNTCHGCWKNYCFRHRLNACERDWNNSCRECVVMIAPRLTRGFRNSSVALLD